MSDEIRSDHRRRVGACAVLDTVEHIRVIGQDVECKVTENQGVGNDATQATTNGSTEPPQVLDRSGGRVGRPLDEVGRADLVGDETFVAAVRAFSPLAVAAVTTIVVSGVVTAITYLGSVSELWSGVYGRTLILKLVLFAAVAALGAYNWRRIRLILDRREQVRILNRTAPVELVIAGLTLAVTAVLVALPLVHD